MYVVMAHVITSAIIMAYATLHSHVPMSVKNFDDVWTLPMQPTLAHVQTATGADDQAELTVNLVPYGSAKVFKVSMFPFV